MTPFIKPRQLPLLGWAAFISLSLFCAYVFYMRPMHFVAPRAVPAQPPAEKGSVEQALQHLADIQASSWMKRRPAFPDLGQGQGLGVLAPAPDLAAVVPQAQADKAAPMDPSLKGAVVVTVGKRPYLVLGLKRFRVGERIGTGETIRALSLKSVQLESPEGRSRAVEIGWGIGSSARQSTW